MSQHPARPPRPASPVRRTVVASAVVLALGLAGCGEDEPPATPAATATAAVATTTTPTATGPVNGTVLPPATSTATSPSDDTSTATALTDDATIAEGTDARRGISIAIEAVGSLDAERARGVVTVPRRAPLAVRRRLARSFGYMLSCDVGGRESQGVEVETTGSRVATSAGTKRTTVAFLEPAKNATIRDGLRACAIQLAPQGRGSTTRSYTSGNPQTAFATVRFR